MKIRVARNPACKGLVTSSMTAVGKQMQAKRGKEATQFQVSSPMQFRIAGERIWRDGWAETMSLTEILFRTAQELKAGKGIDIRVPLPNSGHGSRGGRIVGEAKVRSSFASSERRGQIFVVATLTRLRLSRLSVVPNEV